MEDDNKNLQYRNDKSEYVGDSLINGYEAIAKDLERKIKNKERFKNATSVKYINKKAGDET